MFVFVLIVALLISVFFNIGFAHALKVSQAALQYAATRAVVLEQETDRWKTYIYSVIHTKKGQVA